MCHLFLPLFNKKITSQESITDNFITEDKVEQDSIQQGTEEENKVIIKECQYGFDVTFIISGGPFEMLRLTLYAPNIECANNMKDNFYKTPDKIYDKILSLFTEGEL